MPSKTPTQLESTIPELICPNTHLLLHLEKNYLITSDGKHTYPLVDNIPVFAGLDSFYESRWSQTDNSNGNLRNLLVKKQRFFLKYLKGKTGSILDLGCGGGWKFFTNVGHITGVDLSHSSLKAAASIYNQVVQADWTMLPFPDNSFDIIVSSDVLGHVPYSDKDKVWAEIVRVLRPGGFTLHYIEADSNDPLMQWCKKFPDLYQKYVINPEGHIGMETARCTMNRFRHHGLQPIFEHGVYRLLMYINRIPFLLDNDFQYKAPIIKVFVKFSQLLMSNKIAEISVNMLVAFLMEFTDFLFPENWSNGVLVAYRKPS
jgi:SAM-dependent methyltransferase